MATRRVSMIGAGRRNRTRLNQLDEGVVAAGKAEDGTIVLGRQPDEDTDDKKAAKASAKS